MGFGSSFDAIAPTYYVRCRMLLEGGVFKFVAESGPTRPVGPYTTGHESDRKPFAVSKAQACRVGFAAECIGPLGGLVVLFRAGQIGLS